MKISHLDSHGHMDKFPSIFADMDEESWYIAEYNDIKDFASKLKANGNHQIITWNEI